MTESDTLARARANVTASSAGGAPFLLAFGLTLLAAGAAAFSLPPRTTALIAIFQGNIALPLAFLIERKLRCEPMTPDNPLRPLSIQLAMSQLLGMPGPIVAYAIAPGLVPAMLAFVAAAHLVPYAWLQRTPVYIGLSVIVSGGALAMAMTMGASSGPWVLLLMGAVYWVSAALVYRHATTAS